MKIKINKQEVELKNSIRALMLYEEIMNDSFKAENTKQMVIFFYCVVITSNSDLNITIDLFIDAIDMNPKLLTLISEWYVGVINKTESCKGKKN